MKNFSLLLSLLFVLNNLSSQDRSFGTLAMIENPRPSRTNSKIDSTKFLKAQKIYAKLVNARGDYRYPVPTFVMAGTDNWVAYMDYDKMEIAIETKAYDVCASFGDKEDAAIAFLLGHELSHYYEKHAWKRGFASEFRDLAIGLKIDSLQEDISNETQADYLGGFLAYSAGYGIFDKGADVIKSLYKAYNLPEKLKKYPTLSDRQKMSQRTADKLKQLIRVFDMANLLTVVGNYSDAYAYYKYVLMQYQSREIYNNLGATALLDALQYFSETELKYKYPIQLDLSSSQKAGFGNTREKLIRQAILHFESAINLDPDYAASYLNKACAYALLGDLDRARFYGNIEAKAVAVKNNDSATLIKINVLLGIIEASSGNTEVATKLFQSASDAGNKLAGINLKIIKNEPLGKERESLPGLKKEKIDNLNLNSLISENSFINLKSLTIDQKFICNYVENQGPTSFLYIAQNDNTGKNYYFHGTKPGYIGSTARNIKVGSEYSQVINQYGTPKSVIETPIGPILAYTSIIFILDKNNKVDRWLLYENQ